MKLVAALGGAFLAAILLAALTSLVYDSNVIFDLRLIGMFFVLLSIGFGYATESAKLKNKIMATLVVEGVALCAASIYFMVTKNNVSRYLIFLIVGAAALIIILLLRDKEE